MNLQHSGVFMDRTTKVLLALIAFGLWANVGISTARPALASDADLATIIEKLEWIAGNLEEITTGHWRCTNKKIC